MYMKIFYYPTITLKTKSLKKQKKNFWEKNNIDSIAWAGKCLRFQNVSRKEHEEEFIAWKIKIPFLKKKNNSNSNNFFYTCQFSLTSVW